MSQSRTTNEMTYEGNAVPPKKSPGQQTWECYHSEAATSITEPRGAGVCVPVPYLAIQLNPTFFSSLRK